MIALVSLASLCSGVDLARRATLDLRRTEVLETAAGLALVVGLSLIGASLPIFH